MNIDICVCTFRRTHVIETLQSLALLKLRPDWKIRVIVADNDDTPSARDVVEQTARDEALDVTYVHAPARNISIARNACLDAATAPLLAFIDDDEVASADWLTALVTEMENSRAAAVLGPVEAVYGAECPPWIREGNFHSTKPVWVRGKMITGYTGNVLMRRAAIGNLRFRKELGRSGGEDTAFFTALHHAGGKIAFAPDALVTETIASECNSMRWLLKRYFRSGQTHGFMLLEHGAAQPLGRLKHISLASAKAVFCFIMAVPNMVKSSRARYWFLRGVMHVGVVARLFGKSVIEQYGMVED